MLNKETRNTLNNLIKNIKVKKNVCNNLVKCAIEMNANTFEEVYAKALSDYESAFDLFELYSDKIFYGNLDKSVQSSVNYYRKKTGLKPYKITATL